MQMPKIWVLLILNLTFVLMVIPTFVYARTSSSSTGGTVH